MDNSSLSNSAQTEDHLYNYRLLGLVGQGQYGKVYCGVVPETGKLVALKELDQQKFSSKKFLREFRLLTSLQHPNIVACQTIAYKNNRRYLVMDYCEGGTLRQYLESGQLNLREGLNLIADVLRGLDYIHSRGLIHCDLKPENILLQLGKQSWIAKLSDFGIARAPNEEISGSLGDSGSPAYMAPERFYGNYDFTSDIYAMGIMLYELILGERPFSGTPEELMKAHINQTVELSPKIPYLARCALKRALHKLPNQRFASAAEMLKSVELALQVEVMNPKAGKFTPSTSTPANLIVRQEKLPTPITALAVKGDCVYRGNKSQIICQTYKESPLCGEMARQWQMQFSSTVTKFHLKKNNCFVETEDSTLYNLPTSGNFSSWKASNYQLFSFPSSKLITAVSPAEDWVALTLGDSWSAMKDFDSASFQILKLPNLQSLKAPTSSAIPSHLFALDHHNGLAIFSQQDRETGATNTLLRVFNSGGEFITNINLPIPLTQVTPSSTPFRLFAVIAGEENSGIIINLKPFQISRVSLEILPDAIVATSSGYILVNHQGEFCLISQTGQTIKKFALPLTGKITAIAPCADEGILLATWSENQGTLYTLNLKV